ncbi:MAG: hypothetical protein GY795_04910, partial [Desulfobacterales bacterium]|nr:hypothetical protein [Desulfobacterales bacterium]
MILYTDNQADNAVITSPESSIFNPPSNVKDSRLSRVFKGEEQTSLQIAGSGALKNISQAYTNLVQDPTDLTTSNWDNSALGNVPTLADDYISGYRFSKLTSDGTGAGRYLSQSITLTGDCSCSFYCRYVNADRTRFRLYDFTANAERAEVTIFWLTKTVSSSAGASFKYKFLDSVTVKIDIITTGVIPANNNAYLLFPTEDADTESALF